MEEAGLKRLHLTVLKKFVEKVYYDKAAWISEFLCENLSFNSVFEKVLSYCVIPTVCHPRKGQTRDGDQRMSGVSRGRRDEWAEHRGLLGSETILCVTGVVDPCLYMLVKAYGMSSIRSDG